jgi:hypothetical protein
MPPCGPHLTPLATGSLERSLLVFSTPGGLTGDDLSRLSFTCTNTNQVATCTYNTYPRISPHNVVNHLSHKEATIHRSSNHTWSSAIQIHQLAARAGPDRSLNAALLNCAAIQSPSSPTLQHANSARGTQAPPTTSSGLRLGFNVVGTSRTRTD